MKILVTGCTSRQANPEPRNQEKGVTFARLLADALRDAGHTVEHRNPDILEDLSEFDHVFLGIAPLHGMGSNRAYGALAVVLRTVSENNKLTLFIDDADVGKVVSGLRTMHSDPNRLVKPFFAYKLQHDIASTPSYAGWLREGVKILNENAWPRLLVPFHEWHNAAPVFEKRVPQATGNVCQIDLTAFLPEHEIKEPDIVSDRWVTEAEPGNKWIRQQRLQKGIVLLNKHGEKIHNDAERVNRYSSAHAVLHAPEEPAGWWTSRFGFAARARTPLVTRWQDVQALGPSYMHLADAVDSMSPVEREEVARQQAAALREITPSREAVIYQLDEILKKSEVSA